MVSKVLASALVCVIVAFLIVLFVQRTSPLNDPWASYLAPASVCPNADNQNLPNADQLRSMRCLINWARRHRRLQSVTWSHLLNRSARLKIDADARCQQFTHTPCGQSFDHAFQQVDFGKGHAASRVGENLGYGQDEEGSPRHIVDHWLNSPEHRQNLFDPGWRLGGVAFLRLPSFLGHPNIELWASQFGLILG